jgi:hypothetical protein
MSVQQVRSILTCLAISTIAMSSCSGGPGAIDSGATPIGSCAPSANAAGNEFHVGAYCTHLGNQCSKNLDVSGGAAICAIDVDPQGGNFCIKIGCSSHEMCGTRACCTGREDQPTHACVPADCLTEDGGPCPPIPGTRDAGQTDV